MSEIDTIHAANEDADLVQVLLDLEPGSPGVGVAKKALERLCRVREALMDAIGDHCASTGMMPGSIKGTEFERDYDRA